uniref:Uncharacterized protein n=1 Tax=Arundo donax TaxID=35708 RepID=A0A0A9B068_ARUDO
MLTSPLASLIHISWFESSEESDIKQRCHVEREGFKNNLWATGRSVDG